MQCRTRRAVSGVEWMGHGVLSLDSVDSGSEEQLSPHWSPTNPCPTLPHGVVTRSVVSQRSDVGGVESAGIQASQ